MQRQTKFNKQQKYYPSFFQKNVLYIMSNDIDSGWMHGSDNEVVTITNMQCTVRYEFNLILEWKKH